MDFLRQFVYDRPNFTRHFIQFENVGPLPENENDDQDASDEDNVETDELHEAESATANQHSIPRCPSSQSVSSQSSSSSSENLHMCGMCGIRKKNSLMQCGHAICSVCFGNLKEVRIKECVRYRVVQRRKEEKKMKCPFTACGKRINDRAQQICLDY